MVAAVAPEQIAAFSDEAPEIVSYDVELTFIDDLEHMTPATESFVDSVRDTRGVLIPVLLRQRETGMSGRDSVRYVVLEGRRRINAHHTLGYERIPARVVIKSSWSNDALITYMLNEQRSDNPIVSLDKLQELVAAGWDTQRIASVAHVRPKMVHRYLALGSVISPLREMWKAGSLTFTQVSRIAKLENHQQRELYHWIVKEQPTKTDINAMIGTVKRGVSEASLYATDELKARAIADDKWLIDFGERWGSKVSATAQPLREALRVELTWRIEHQQEVAAAPVADTSPAEGDGADLPAGDGLPEPRSIGDGATEIVDLYDNEDDIPL